MTRRDTIHCLIGSALFTCLMIYFGITDADIALTITAAALGIACAIAFGYGAGKTWNDTE